MFGCGLWKEKGGQKTFLQKKEPERDSIQQVNADPNCNQTIEGTFPRTQICIDKWTELTDDQEILDIVSGYQLDFSEIPHQQKPPTPFNLSEEEERLVDLEVEKLLRKGAIEEVEPCENQFLSNIFTIPKKGGERRPVVDMRDLNNFIEPVHFKMEDLSHLPSLLRRGDFMCKIDLKDAYQTIPIAKKSRIYLRFLWRGRLYQFTCLPFGLRSSPRIFTKVLKPLLVYLRALGVRLLVYLDDILIMAATPELCLEHMQLTWQLLTDLGFLGNLKKSVLAPKQQAEYLGFIVNSTEMKLFLTEEKLLRSKLKAEMLLKSNPVVKI